MWGHFLWQGVIDPLGGINSLWPLFGIANQLLAAVALCVATTVIIKMGKARYAWTTMLPLAWFIIVTMSAGWAKLFSPQPRLGFLAHARVLQAAREAGTLPPGVKNAGDLTQMIANDYLDAAVAAFFLVSVIVILADSAREWYAVLSGAKAARSTEVPYEPRAFAAGD
jgi:carbon starvation protein